MTQYMPRKVRSNAPFVTLLLTFLCFGLQAVCQEPATQGSSQASHEAHTYRLTYTVTESDAGKRTGTQHYAMTIVPDTRAVMKQGSREPVLTGGYMHDSTSDGTQYQFTYLDVGWNIEANLDERPGGLRLQTKVEESSIVSQASHANPQSSKDPAVQQIVLQAASYLKAGVPMIVGAIDVPDSTRHLEIEVTIDRLP